jgi:tripartite-type tricarboxylate transporter receptor subunit TctC
MRFMIRCLSAMLFVTVASAAQAQGYPSKPIRMYVPFAPGGVVDVTARILANKLTERLGWTILAENKPGGNRFIAVSAAAKSEPAGNI